MNSYLLLSICTQQQTTIDNVMHTVQQNYYKLLKSIQLIFTKFIFFNYFSPRFSNPTTIGIINNKDKVRQQMYSNLKL